MPTDFNTNEMMLFPKASKAGPIRASTKLDKPYKLNYQFPMQASATDLRKHGYSDKPTQL
jgi:hypothetical protein